MQMAVRSTKVWKEKASAMMKSKQIKALLKRDENKFFLFLKKRIVLVKVSVIKWILTSRQIENYTAVETNVSRLGWGEWSRTSLGIWEEDIPQTTATTLSQNTN